MMAAAWLIKPGGFSCQSAIEDAATILAFSKSVQSSAGNCPLWRPGDVAQGGEPTSAVPEVVIRNQYAATHGGARRRHGPLAGSLPAPACGMAHPSRPARPVA